jgi:hypothetical protein
MPIPATGGNLLLALGLEPEYGVPGTGLIAYRARLPVKAALAGAESPSAAVNPSGFIERGLPGPKGGAIEWSLPLRAGELLEFLEHLFGAVAKTTLEAGVHRYTFTPTSVGVDTSFHALYAAAPVESWWLHGIKLGSLAAEIGDNSEIAVKLQGLLGHGTRLGAAVPGPGNAGTYDRGPCLRGVLRDRAAGDIHVLVTRVDGGLQFKAAQSTAAAPAFGGPDVDAADIVLDPETQRGTWQNLQGADGLDLGLWDEDKDPLEIIWPGSPADHAALAVGNTYRFPVSWTAPAVPFLTGHQRLTSAHWILKLRTAGSPTWLTKPVNTGKLSISRAVTANRGNSSRYVFGLIRDGRFTPTLELSRKLVDSFFADRAERHERLEGQLLFTGRQLGSGFHREGLTFTFAALRIDAAERTATTERAIEEKLKLTGETNDAGAPPLTVEVITSRDWTPSA